MKGRWKQCNEAEVDEAGDLMEAVRGGRQTSADPFPASDLCFTQNTVKCYGNVATFLNVHARS